MNPRERRAARHQPPNPEVQDDHPRPRRRTGLITVEQVIDIALDVIATEGYEALSMRRLATGLGTGPASLYAHVVNKADLDELLIGRLCAELVLPEPDPAAWREQIRGVCTQLRDQYLKYPESPAPRSRCAPPTARPCASPKECWPSCSPAT